MQLKMSNTHREIMTAPGTPEKSIEDTPEISQNLSVHPTMRLKEGFLPL